MHRATKVKGGNTFHGGTDLGQCVRGLFRSPYDIFGTIGRRDKGIPDQAPLQPPCRPLVGPHRHRPIFR